MIVVAIVAIIAAIAYPSYRDQVLRSRRAAARAATMDIAARQEQFFLSNRTYTDSLDNLGTPDETEDGFYALAVTAQPCGSLASCYTVEAAPQGSQADDSCGTLTLTSGGVKAPAGCW
jgi:type IV pilus assembly protein PilE